MAALFYIPPNEGSSFSTSLPMFVIFWVFCLFVCFAVVILMGVTWYLIVVLICSPLMVRAGEHLFTFIKDFRMGAF